MLFEADDNELKAFPEGVAPVHVVFDDAVHVEKRSEEEESLDTVSEEDEDVDVEKRGLPPKTHALAKADYLRRYKDVRDARMDAWLHYVQYGKAEGRVWRGPGGAPGKSVIPNNPKPALTKWGSQTIYGESLGNWHKTWCGWGLGEEPGMVVSRSCLDPITH